MIPDIGTMALGELCNRLDARRIRINPKYQRSGKIWPPRAKSFLVETILVGMPIPRVLLHKLDREERGHDTDIIDGQQRCRALAAFRANKFSLTGDVDDQTLTGKKFRDLSTEQQAAFDRYEVPIDEYSGVRPAQIRELFRRLNYYTAPLNAAEQRHAQFYGELAGFVEKQAVAWRPTFVALGVFTKNQLNRKADEQLMAEVVDAMINGITTTTAKTLRTVYKKYDPQFGSITNFRRRLDTARAHIDQWTSIHHTVLAKHYELFALIIATIHATTDLVSVRSNLGRSAGLQGEAGIARRLSALERAIVQKTERGRYARFWAASHEKTNVRENRVTRCEFFYKAIVGD